MNKPGEPKTTYLPFGLNGPPATRIGSDEPWFGPQDLYLFNEGSHLRLYEKLGSHPTTVGRRAGLPLRGVGPERGLRRAWSATSTAGTAARTRCTPSARRACGPGSSPGRRPGTCYKYHIAAPGGFTAEKTDPFAFTCEIPPKSAAVTWDLSYEWNDADWMANRKAKGAHDTPVSIYEVHLGSWMRRGRPAVPLAELPRHRPRSSPTYCKDMGFTHVEFLPITEHPFFASWGYQTTGYFAATSRYGTPQDLMFLIDTLHQARRRRDPRLGAEPLRHRRLGAGQASTAPACTSTPTAARGSTRTGAASSSTTAGTRSAASCCRAPCSGSTSTTSTACAWMRSRRCCTSTTRARRASGCRTSTAGRRTSTRSRSCGGSTRRCTGTTRTCRRYAEEIDRVGDGVAADVRRRARVRVQVGHGVDARHAASTSRYDPIHRKYHQNDLTFRMLYAYNENFVLPLSHDEVVHGKGPLWDKMAGRRVAEVRRAAAAVRLPVGHDRQEAAVHGRRDRPAAGVAARPERRLAPAEVRRRTRACSSWSAT